MKKFKFNNVTIFDSADLRVSVNVVNSKKLPDKEIGLVYQNDTGIAINPSVFLVFGFKNGDGSYTSAYLSYPHLRDLRKCMFRIVTNESKLENTKPFGHEKQSLSFTEFDNGIVIELLDSKNQPAAGAPLSYDSFAALEGAVADLDLTSIAVMTGIAYLQAEEEREVNTQPNQNLSRPTTYVKPNIKK